MKFSSRTLVKVNFAIFSFVFLGCGGFANSNFIAESRPTSEKCDVLNDGGKIIKDLIGQIKEKNTNGISFISGKKTNKNFIPDLYIKNYEVKAKTYFSKKNFSLSEDFDQEFFNYAKQLYENKAPDILFKLVCCAINIYYIIDNNKIISKKIKEEKLSKVYETFLKIVDYLIARNLGLLELENKNSTANGNSIPKVDPTYCLFKCKDLIENLKQLKNNELYTCDTMVFPCGIFGNILEQFMSPTIDENGFDVDITVKKTFEILNKTNGSEGCELIKRYLYTCLLLTKFNEIMDQNGNSYPLNTCLSLVPQKDSNNDKKRDSNEKDFPVDSFITTIYNHFIPLLPNTNKANPYNIVMQRPIGWKKLIDSLNILNQEINSKPDEFITFSSIFTTDKIYGRYKILLQNPSSKIFVKQPLQSDEDKYTYIVSKDIVNSKNFRKLNDALKIVFGISQKDILDIIGEFLQNNVFDSYDCFPRPICDKELFTQKVKEKTK